VSPETFIVWRIPRRFEGFAAFSADLKDNLGILFLFWLFCPISVDYSWFWAKRGVKCPFGGSFHRFRPFSPSSVRLAGHFNGFRLICQVSIIFDDSPILFGQHHIPHPAKPSCFPDLFIPDIFLVFHPSK
jgi:hypothetical protein